MFPGIDTETVLETAIELADTLGYEQVTLGLLAKQLGIKTPSLYNHIDGLPDLRKKLALSAMRQLRERLAEATIGKAGEEAIYAVGTAYITFVREHPGLYDATLGAPDQQHMDVKAAGEELLNLLLRVLAAFQLEQDDALHAVRGLRSIVHGFASLEANHGFNMALDRDESFRRLITTYTQGLSRQVYDEQVPQ